MSHQRVTGHISTVWSDKASMYCLIALVFLTYLYMHLIYTSVDPKATPGFIWNLQWKEKLRRV